MREVLKKDNTTLQGYWKRDYFSWNSFALLKNL